MWFVLRLRRKSVQFSLTTSASHQSFASQCHVYARLALSVCPVSSTAKPIPVREKQLFNFHFLYLIFIQKETEIVKYFFFYLTINLLLFLLLSLIFSIFFFFFFVLCKTDAKIYGKFIGLNRRWMNRLLDQKGICLSTYSCPCYGA